MKRIALAFSSLFKSTSGLKVQLTIDETSSCGQVQSHTISDVEYLQLRELALARNEAIAKVLVSNSNDLTKLRNSMDEIDQQFDAAILSILLSKQGNEPALS